MSDAAEIRALIEEAVASSFEMEFNKVSEKLNLRLETHQRANNARADQMLRAVERCADQVTACVTEIAKVHADVGLGRPDYIPTRERLQRLDYVVSQLGESVNTFFDRLKREAEERASADAELGEAIAKERNRVAGAGGQ